MSRADLRLANDTWEAVMVAHARLTSRFAAERMWGPVSMREYDVLYALVKHGGPMRLGELQGGVLLSQPALSRLVGRLVERGLLARASDAEDGRAVRISLTEEGARVQREVGRAHARSVARELRAALSPAELRELGRLAAKLGGAESQTVD